MKLTACELDSYIDGKSSFAAFQQGVCQFDSSTQSRDMVIKVNMLDKMTYGISEFAISDLMTSDSIDPRTLYARGSMK